MNLLLDIFVFSLSLHQCVFPFFSLFQSLLLPRDFSSTPLSHMSVLLGVELQIPIDVGELRLHPLSQSSWNYMFFSLLATVHSNIPKCYCFIYILCIYCLFCMSGMETGLLTLIF